MSAARPTALASSRFAAFLVTQFLGAANDNAFKITLMLTILARFTDESQQLRLTSLVTLLFPLPFLIFSPLAGSIADRFSKERLLFVTKAPEVLAMLLAIGALASGSFAFLLAVLFLMSTQSAFFSPVKYGLLPESLAPGDLSMANGLLQMTTNVAILAGTVGGMLVYERFHDSPGRIGWIFLAIAIAGSACALHAPRTPPGRADTPFAWNLAATGMRDWVEARRQPVLFQTILGIAFFGFLGGLFLTVIPVYAANNLQLPEAQAGLFLVLLSVGIALGSVVAGKLSAGRVEIGLVPLGSLGLSLVALDLGFFGEQLWRGLPIHAWGAVFLLGFCAGLYVVPLNALLQQRSPEGMKGRLIAFSNVLTFAAVLLAALMPPVLTLLSVDTRGIIVVTGLLSLGVTVYVVSLLPDFTVRLVLLLLVRSFYRVRVVGSERLPRGGGLLVANHVSWIDALLVGTACDRVIRFVMYRPFYEARGLHWFWKRMHVIPISGHDSDEQKAAAIEQARGEIERGHLVCIFAEGAISRTGNLLRFRRGLERIACGIDAPIVPVALDGVWGSVFSWEKGRLLWKRPRRSSEPVQVIFGDPLPASTPADRVREKVQELMVGAFEARKARQRPLSVEFVRTAKRFWHRPFVADLEGRALTFGEALGLALCWRRALDATHRDAGGEFGILLPQGVPAVVANLAIALDGRPVINLEADASATRLRRQVEEAAIGRVLTSRDWVERLPGRTALEGLPLAFVEDLPGPRPSRLLTWGLWLLPRRLALRSVPRGNTRDVDRTAAVVFSTSPRLTDGSGGVRLSHHNVLSNLESQKQVFRVSREDRILGTLPFSNAFGLTGTLFLPAIAGVRVAYAGRADDMAGLERLIRERRITILPVSTALLAAIVEALPADALRNLRHAVVAGGLLTADLRQRFEERFGVQPLEGFGCAECGPLVSLNVPVVVRDARGQTSHRPGTSGQPLPGIAVRVVDPVTGDSLPTGRHGVLMVRGPNVMQGYLGAEERTTRVLREGWFRTEYLAEVDSDGFLTVLGLAEDGRCEAERRPRDRFGRPLPPGSRDELGAVEPARVVQGPGEAIARARAIFNEQRFFEAHEFFEHLWKSPDVSEADRALWRGLAQIAGGLCHLQRGNLRGARALLQRGIGLIEGFPPEHEGLETGQLAADCQTLVVVLERGPGAEIANWPSLETGASDSR